MNHVVSPLNLWGFSTFNSNSKGISEKRENTSDVLRIKCTFIFKV